MTATMRPDSGRFDGWHQISTALARLLNPQLTSSEITAEFRDPAKSFRAETLYS